MLNEPQKNISLYIGEMLAFTDSDSSRARSKKKVMRASRGAHYVISFPRYICRCRSTRTLPFTCDCGLIMKLSTFSLLLATGLLNAIILTTASCSNDMDCSLNGVCTDGVCKCDTPWFGESCGGLEFMATPPGGAYGFGKPFEVTSWGGNSIEYDGMWHLFVTEMGGKTCGLQAWGSQSTVTHAISPNVTGPYTKVRTAIPHEAHNPQVIVINGSWYIFHIGSANSKAPTKDCHNNVSQFTRPSSSRKQSGTIHKAASPNGDFVPIDAVGYPSCNNPSPFQHANGTLFVACKWGFFSAPKPEGPWTRAATLQPPNVANRTWEDPFLFINERGFHILSHTWSALPYPSNAISGHAFSLDGVTWVWSAEEPYNNVVSKTDGTVHQYATLERPKFVFADPSNPHRPTHLFNGVSPYWNSSNAADPCEPCIHCSRCKVTKGIDWTYTLLRTLVQQQPPRGASV
eukprot:m.185024 g.185024  ORF g.185024 m.185024 type:complete len:459 (-) comp32214_c9_seq1:62-1438(-)